MSLQKNGSVPTLTSHKSIISMLFVILTLCVPVANAGFQSGTNNGYYWQLWTSDSLSGSVNYSNGSGGNYSVNWNANGNFTCGKGWSTGSSSRVVGYNAGSYSQSGGGGSFALYGWTRNPLIEYYVQERWPGSRPTSGTNMGRISSDGGSYDLRREQRTNAPSIDGTQTFWQLKSTRTSQNSTGSNHNITFANHANGWRNGGMSLGSSHSYQIMLTEAWGNSSGNANVTVWDAGSSSGSGSSSSSSSSSSTSGGGGGSCTLTLRGRSTDGQGKVRLTVGGNTVGDWTLGSSMSNHSVTLWSSQGNTRAEFYNDASGRDVQIDYLSVCGSTRQAESRVTNTGVYQNSSCGGSSSEWLHCNGYIDFGDTSY